MLFRSLSTRISMSAVGIALALALPTAAEAGAQSRDGRTARNGPFAWSSSGPISGMKCVQTLEKADPHTWADNYFCARSDIGMRWSSSGAIAGMRCTKVHEGADPHTWNDNYLCVPNNAPVRFTWSSSGPVAGKTCVQWIEKSDPHTWTDNYMCWERDGRSLDGYKSYNEPFAWSSGGPISGMPCTQILEKADPHTWNDNYFCGDSRVRWNSSGPIAGMRCTAIAEGADPHTWKDNYLCVPNDFPYAFSWKSNGPIPGRDCLQWTEKADPHTWADNYLCWTKAKVGSTAPPSTAPPSTPGVPKLDVHAKDEFGRTALHNATNRGDVGQIRDLLEKGASPDVPDNNGQTPLMASIKARRTDVTQTLLDAGASPNKTSGGATPLSIAVGQGDLKVTKLLIAKGARPNDTLVASTTTSGRRDMLDTLLDAGGNPSAGLSPAIAKKDPSLVGHLIARGGQPVGSHVTAAVGSGSTRTLQAVLDGGGSPDLAVKHAIETKKVDMAMVGAVRGGNGTPYMGQAVGLGNGPLLQTLIDHGSDPNPGMDAASRAKRPDLLRILLEGGANARPPSFISAASGNGDVESAVLLLDRGAPAQPGLLPAVQAGHRPVVGLLLKRGADASSEVPISTASGLGHAEIVRMLHKAGGPVQPAITPACKSGHTGIMNYLADNGADATGRECMVSAVRGRHANTVSALLQRGATVEWHVDRKGTTLAHAAATNQDAATLSKLIAAGAPCTVADDSGVTPLHAAADQKRNVPVLELLVQAGADVNSVDDKGKSVLKHASGRQNSKWLKERGATK